MTRDFAAIPGSLSEMRGWIRTLTEERGLPSHEIADIVLAASEAGANAVRHGGSEPYTVSVSFRDDATVVEVRDRGVFQRRLPIPEVNPIGGHGIPLMAALMDEIAIAEGTESRRGTVVRLVRRRDDALTAR